MRSLLGTLAALLGGLLAASAASAEAKGWDSYGPGPKDMTLEKIQFTASSLMFSPSKASVAFGLEIESRTDTPIWVKVAIQGPQSEPVCEQVVAISGKHTATIACARDSIAPLGPPSEGTLTVSPEGVEWKAKKRAVSVPAAQIRTSA